VYHILRRKRERGLGEGNGREVWVQHSILVNPPSNDLKLFGGKILCSNLCECLNVVPRLCGDIT